MANCAYGIENGSTVALFFFWILLWIVQAIVLFLFHVLSYAIMWKTRMLFSHTMVLLPPILAPPLIDTIAMNFPTWKYLGPGDAFDNDGGTTANGYMFGVSVYHSVVFRVILFTLLFAAFLADLLGRDIYDMFQLGKSAGQDLESPQQDEGTPKTAEDGIDVEKSQKGPEMMDDAVMNFSGLKNILTEVSKENFKKLFNEVSSRAKSSPTRESIESKKGGRSFINGLIRGVSGTLITVLASILVCLWAYNYGVPSYYLGKAGDTVNGEKCSGPYAWSQESGVVKTLLVIAVLYSAIDTRLTNLVFLIVTCFGISRSEHAFPAARGIVVAIVLGLKLVFCGFLPITQNENANITE